MTRFIVKKAVYNIIKKTLRDDFEIGWFLFASKKRDNEYEVFDAMVASKKLFRDETELDKDVRKDAESRAKKENLIVIDAHSHPSKYNSNYKVGYENPLYFLPSIMDIRIYKKNDFMCLVSREGKIILRFYSFNESKNAFDDNKSTAPGLIDWFIKDKKRFEEIITDLKDKFNFDIKEYLIDTEGPTGSYVSKKKYPKVDEYIKEHYKHYFNDLFSFRIAYSLMPVFENILTSVKWIIHDTIYSQD